MFIVKVHYCYPLGIWNHLTVLQKPGGNGFVSVYNITPSAVTVTLVVWTVCFEDGRQFIAEWKEHLASYANEFIIYFRALAFFSLLLLHPLAIHLSSEAWGIIFADHFIFSLPFRWVDAHTHAVIFVKSEKKNQIWSSKGWIIDVLC